jgi:hypothetical protein
MSASLATLAREKELLLARSALCRLRLRGQSCALRDSLRWPRIAAAAASAPASRRALLSIALSLPALARTARFAVAILRIVLVAKLAFSLIGHARELAGSRATAPPLR